MEQPTFGLRQLLRAVNLKDFAQMIVAELANLGMSARLALDSFPRRPFGPFIFLAAMLLILLRTLLLAFVVLVFGTAILIISAARAINRQRAGGEEP